MFSNQMALLDKLQPPIESATYVTYKWVLNFLRNRLCDAFRLALSTSLLSLLR